MKNLIMVFIFQTCLALAQTQLNGGIVNYILGTQVELSYPFNNLRTAPVPSVYVKNLLDVNLNLDYTAKCSPVVYTKSNPQGFSRLTILYEQDSIDKRYVFAEGKIISFRGVPKSYKIKWEINPLYPTLVPNFDPFYYYGEEANFVLAANGLDKDSLYSYKIEVNGRQIWENISGRSNFTLSFSDTLLKYTNGDPSIPDNIRVTGYYRGKPFKYLNSQNQKIENSVWDVVLKAPSETDGKVDLDIFTNWTRTDIDTSKSVIEKKRLYWGNKHTFRFCWNIKKGDKNILLPPNIVFGDLQIETEPKDFFDKRSMDIDENWTYIYLKRSEEIKTNLQLVKVQVRFTDRFGNDVSRNFQAELYR